MRKKESAEVRLPDNVRWLKNTIRDIAGLVGCDIKGKVETTVLSTKEKLEIEFR